MALDNIFMGKRVVQQAYLNNALLYQANGWKGNPEDYSETVLPSFTPDSNTNSTISELSNITYLEDDTLLIQYTTGSRVTGLAKISLTGDVIWQTIDNTYRYLRKELRPYLRGYNKSVAGSGQIYNVSTNSYKYPVDTTTNSFSITAYSNATGKVTKYLALRTLSGYESNVLSLADACFDNDYIYMYFSSYYGTAYVSKFTYDMEEVVHLYKIDAAYGSSIALDASGNYLYANTTSYNKTFKINKSTFAVTDSFQPSSNYPLDNTYTDKYIIDSMNNLYFYATHQYDSTQGSKSFVKYSIPNKKLVYRYEIPVSSPNYYTPFVIDAVVDPYYNSILLCYGIEKNPKNTTDNHYYLVKLDPNGNVLWERYCGYGASDGFSTTSGALAVTKQGTIYLCNIGKNNFKLTKILGLKKLTNSAIV